MREATADASRAASFKERRKQLMERQKPPAPDRSLPLPPPRSLGAGDRKPTAPSYTHPWQAAGQAGARWAGSHWEW